MLVGVDTGGTFTDLVAVVGGNVFTHKVLSTPTDPADAVLRGLSELLARAWGVSTPRLRGMVRLTYSSTVATNALLERRGARVLLLTTSGFEDLIEIGRQDRPQLYALEPEKPEPLVDRSLRLGVPERMLFDGSVFQPLSRTALGNVRRAVRRAAPDAVAVCLLHAYANPAHEKLVAEALAHSGVFVSLSHELVPEHREYERLSTTVINSYVGPVMSRHLAALERGVPPEVGLRVLQSNGGALSPRLAAREAVRTCLSGPAGGVIGASRVAEQLGIRKAITLDMGGTSTDVSLLLGGARRTTEWEIGGLPLKVPSIDIHTVGAGGGSLARRDLGGALKVGPESAGADPGPACYGRGTQATVTDANLVLGRLVADAFLDGRMRLQPRRAERALGNLGRDLGRSPEKAAEGVVRVVNAGMERALRRISVERGHDPRDFALIVFGGAGGQHACELADALQIRRVIVPRHPGLLSAWGASTADVERDYVRAVQGRDADPEVLLRLARPLVARARREMKHEAVPTGALDIRTFVDVRYKGQSHEIGVTLDMELRSSFEREHERLYGYRDPERSLEAVNIRVRAAGRGKVPHPGWIRPGRSATPQRHRVFAGGQWRAATLWRRDALPTGRGVPGPAVIVEFSASTFVAPSWKAVQGKEGHLVLERVGRKG